MASVIDPKINKEIEKNNKDFFDKITSTMNYKSNISGDVLNFECLDIIWDACPYIDNVVRNPKLILINNSSVELIEKAKKVTAESVKDLARHTYYIDEFSPENNSVRPNKILNIYSEETYNIYENKFLYTLIFFITKFVMKKEKELNELEIDRYRKLVYSGETKIGQEDLEIKLIIKGTDRSNANNDKKLNEDIKRAKERLSRIKDYISGWSRSELIKSLEKARVKLINPPIKKTNIILKNPNFQVAVNLWNYLYNYDENESEERKNLDEDGNNLLTGLLEHAFLVDYYVMDSVCKTKVQQKEKLGEYAYYLITEEINRLMTLLKKCGFKITDEEILELIAKNLGNIKGELGDKNNLANQDIKKKFKNAMDDYLERVQEYL